MSSPRFSAIEQNHIDDESSHTNSSNSLGKIRFRHGSSARYDSNFNDQVWVKLPGKIGSDDFIDESPELDEIYTVIARRESTSTSDLIANWSENPHPIIFTGLIERRPSATSRTEAFRKSISKEQERSPVKKRRVDDDTLSASSKRSAVKSYPRRPAKTDGHLTESNVSGEMVHQRPVDYDLSTIFPRELIVQNEVVDVLSQSEIQQASLLRYFADELAGWFDLCDPERHFALVVPQRAKHCPALLNAIYTASARYLSRLERYRNNGMVEYNGNPLPNLNMETAAEYHSKCTEHLVSVSDNLDVLYDENLLVASVILRFYEEIDAPLSGGDGAPKGTQVFLTAQASGCLDSSLRRAAFRVAYRQEVHMAFLRQRPFHMPLQYHEYRSLEYADDFTWAYRTIVHCADVLQYCYGLGSKSNSDYDMLVQYHEGWESLRPRSFDALYDRAAVVSSRRALPEIWYLSDCHVTAHQHMDISRILLTTYDPRIPRLGPGLKAVSQDIEAQINTIVKRLCGVAISNHRSPSAMNIAYMAITMCGEQFTDIEDRGCILEVLKYTEQQHALPTAHIRSRLIEAWECSGDVLVNYGQEAIEGCMDIIDQ